MLIRIFYLLGSLTISSTMSPSRENFYSSALNSWDIMINLDQNEYESKSEKSIISPIIIWR